MLQGLDGKVAIVTGAGRGLGRVEALELARQGVRVVVNDLGRQLDGQPEESPAQQVVEEIKALGGDAIAHGGDVADWNDAQDMIKTAVATFGGLDILVNNAGFLRDRVIFNMSEEDFDDVVRVHLKGHFCMIRWASTYWRDKGKAEGGPVYGRIISTSSEAGLGTPSNAGQPNYAPAKAGIIQLTMVASAAMQKYGVTANVICPRAKTRMTEHQSWVNRSEDGVDVFAPENVSPMVAFLASPDAGNINGQVFVVYGKMVTLIAPSTPEQKFEATDPWTPDSVSAAVAPYFVGRDPDKVFILKL